MKPVFDPWLVIIVSYLGSQSLRPPNPTSSTCREIIDVATLADAYCVGN